MAERYRGEHQGGRETRGVHQGAPRLAQGDGGEGRGLAKGARRSDLVEPHSTLRHPKEREELIWPQLSSWPLRIASYNNFPTAAGLASSASGLAALVASLAQLYELPQTPSELSRIARQGSGSACRSLFGGFVAWREGKLADGSDSLAEEVAPRDHWPEMHALICVVSDAKKGTSSTSGMQRTVETSPLLQHRLKVVPDRMEKISKAILEKDFDTFAQITMADSNQFHAVCLDTSPPIFYLNDVSRSLIALIEELNRAALLTTGHLVAAYTFDAGPNCVIYALEPTMRLIISTVNRFFPQEGQFPDPFGLFEGQSMEETALLNGFNGGVIRMGGWEKGAVKSLIHTRVGDGPRRLGKEESLLKEDGTPKTLA